MTSGDLEQRDVDYQPCYEMEGPGEGCSAKLGEYAKDDPLAGVHIPTASCWPLVQHPTRSSRGVRPPGGHRTHIADPSTFASEDMPGQSLWGENERMPANYYDKLPGADFNDLIGSPTDDSSSGIREEQLRALATWKTNPLQPLPHLLIVTIKRRMVVSPALNSGDTMSETPKTSPPKLRKPTRLHLEAENPTSDPIPSKRGRARSNWHSDRA